ncbi:MAG: T9SS type A sorting domain-containing protein [Ignavibacteriales bacterium]|nr:T9SS type A sorting domain-containing protein [Ignavibacteriales bacterium]
MIRLIRKTLIPVSFLAFFILISMTTAQDKIDSPDKSKVLPAKEIRKEHDKKNIKKLFSGRKKKIKGLAKSDEPDMFAEFQKKIRTRDGDTEPKYSPNYLMEELYKSQKQSRLYKTTTNLNWVERGPGNVSGRTRGIIVDPTDTTNKTWFAGSVSGGIWKTTNAGESWESKTQALPNLATTVLAQSASNPGIIYCGTGEGFFNADAVNGSGIFKSVDHGETWTQLSSTANLNFSNVNRIIVDPYNPNILLACTNPLSGSSSTFPGGIWRSIDGGTSWQRTYSSLAKRTQDLKADPLNFLIQYCTVNNDGVYKSTDGGLSWTKSSTGLVTTGRIEIAVSGKNPNYIYASCEEKNSTSGLYVSVDKAATWKLVNSEDGSTKNWLTTQGWYDNTIAVHPFDENTVFFGGIDLWKAKLTSSTDTTRLAIFSHVTDGYNQYNLGSSAKIHVDQHSIVPVPLASAPGTFWIVNGNDGGVAVSTNGGTTWREALNGGYNTTQFYGVDKKPGFNEYIGGTQDNGTWLSPKGENASPITAYKNVIGGDGFDVAWHYKDPNKIIGGSQYNGFYRTTDGGNNWLPSTTNLADVGSGKGVFISKIAKSNSDPDLIFTTGSQGVWRSEDFGGAWEKSSITSNDWSYSPTSTPVAISIADPQIVWAGSFFSNYLSKLFLSIDGGLTFASLPKYSGSALGSITGIDTHPTDRKTAYVTFSFSGAPKILRTTNLGISWEDISGFGSGSISSNGFPNVATYCVLVMPYNTDIIWAGTEIGLFVSTNNGVTWLAADNGLPAVCIWDMKIVDDQVVLATHGRGIWSVTLPDLSTWQPPVVTLSPIISALSQGVDKAINLSAKLRSGYDSTLVMIDGQKLIKLASTSVKDTSFKFIPTTFGTKNIQLIAYKSGLIYKSSSRTLIVYNLKPTTVRYSNNFEVDDYDFAGNGFGISTPSQSGFTSQAINSLHPYAEATDYYYNLLVPIKISWSPNLANIEYDDIAIVEPGDDPNFGDPNFYDYVVVEGSKDGLNWIPLADGYDCRYNNSWKTLYDSPNVNPTAANYVQHKIDMTKKFNNGDVIFIRFHLYSDEAAVGWGWAIDNLEIQPNASDVEKENTIPTAYSLSQNYPNPFNPETTIKFTLPKRSKVKLEIFDTLGRVVSTLVNSDLDAGSYRYNWNASNFASGVYIYRLTANDFASSKKLMLVK